jgi:drug efflux transport system ATP-binding protein
MSLIRARNLSKTYPSGTVALKSLSFDIQEGELFGVVGPDGAGKTTLIQILSGLLNFEGEVWFKGEPLRKGSNLVRDAIGYIPQRFSLYSDLSVEENVVFYRDLYPRKEGSREVDSLLDFIGLSAFRNRLAGALSGGMKQKLSLLCALIHEPKILMMDEPTVGVDPVSRREFWSLVFELQDQGLTVVSSTPYLDEAEQFDRVALVNQGEFLRLGTVEELKKSVKGEVLRLYSDEAWELRERALRLDFVDDAQLFGDRVHVFTELAAEQARQRLLRELGLVAADVEFAEHSIEDIFLLSTGVLHV